MRKSDMIRKTNETDIALTLNIDGTGSGDIATGSGFFDHMLTLFCRHARVDLDVRCDGDTDVDFHHTVEDVGICLGRACAEALGDMRGIMRYGSATLPMDEALVLAAVDISGRGHLEYDLPLPSARVGSFDTELTEEFFAAFARSAGVTLHLRLITGRNTHHIIECAFKAFARAMRAAAAIDPDFADEVPSTKGVLK